VETNFGMMTTSLDFRIESTVKYCCKAELKLDNDKLMSPYLFGSVNVGTPASYYSESFSTFVSDIARNCLCVLQFLQVMLASQGE
jgi:hypothetical protein